MLSTFMQSIPVHSNVPSIAAAENTIIGVTGAKPEQNADYFKELIRTQIDRL